MSGASAQAVKPYRIHILKDSVGADFDVESVGIMLAPNEGNAIAINNLGIVGGMFETGSATGIYHGFVWFPNDLGVSGFGFPLRQLIDIHPLAFPTNPPDNSIVNDISWNRALVGFAGDEVGTDGHAFAFPLNLAAPSIGADDLHTTSGAFSCAFGVDDATTATVVGITSEDCPTDNPDFQGPFRTTWSTGGAGTMVVLPLLDEGDFGVATEVARAASTFLASGETNHCEVDEDDDICTKSLCTFVCLVDNQHALRWPSTTSFDDLADIDSNDDAGVNGRGINNDGDVCGWGWEGATPNCKRRAAFWSGSSNASHVPGATMPSDQTDEQSWAEGISPRTVDGCVTLVGLNLEQQRGLIWHGFDSTWCVEDLNDITLPCTNGYLIRRAFDINRYRHVTVLVQSESGNHIGVLTSAADYNGDLKVDSIDRNALFANYCSSGCSAAQLEYDLNCDGVVNASDMALLTGTYWSGTSLAAVPNICECEQGESMSALSEGVDEATALASLGFTSWETFSDWLMTAETDAADAACETIHTLLNGGAE